jgi:hypothetical protein
MRRTIARLWDRPRRRGQALVELAIMLPFLLFLMMGIIQVGALAMVWIALQGVAQDSARWMAVSSQARPPTAACNWTTQNSNYPRPRWADGDYAAYSVNYRDCNLPPILIAGNFTNWQWTPACSGNGTDCVAQNLRRPDQMLTLTATYNWSNVIFIPTGLRGWFNWAIPPTVTVTVAEVMQY